MFGTEEVESDLCFGDTLVPQNCSGEWYENV